MGGLVDFEVGIDIPGYLGPLSPRHLLSLTLTVKHNDVEPPGARPAGLRGYSEPRVTRPRPRNDTRSKPFMGHRNRYISQKI